MILSKPIKIFGPEVLNIFCDASIERQHGVRTFGCPGSIAVYNDEVIDYESTILVDSTNNESEIYAILLATGQAVKYKDQYRRINIFSDSRISVQGIRDWMISWVKNQKNGILVSSSGTEVANQQIFLHVINMILNNLDEYHLYHIDGHVTKNGILKAMADFAKFNGIQIGPIEADYLCKYNNIIDNSTRDDLAIADLNSLSRLNQGFIYPIPTVSDMNRFRKEIMGI